MAIHDYKKLTQEEAALLRAITGVKSGETIPQNPPGIKAADIPQGETQAVQKQLAELEEGGLLFHTIPMPGRLLWHVSNHGLHMLAATELGL